MIKKEVTIVEIIRAVEGKSKELKRALAELVPRSRAAKGCLQYDLLEPCEGEEEFLVLMRFETVADLRQHETSSYVEEFVRKYDQILYRDVTISEWKKFIIQ